jgi:hypothetical protein
VTYAIDKVTQKAKKSMEWSCTGTPAF